VGLCVSRKLVAFAVGEYAKVRVASPVTRKRIIDVDLDLSDQIDRYEIWALWALRTVAH